MKSVMPLAAMKSVNALSAVAQESSLVQESEGVNRTTLACFILHSYHVPTVLAGGKSKCYVITTNRMGLK